MADVASIYVGEREQGQNKGGFVRRVWEVGGFSPWFYRTAQPWCAAFVRMCAIQAGEIRPGLSTIPPARVAASVAGWLTWCQSFAVQLPRDGGKKGDVLIFLPRLSHIGIIEERTAAGYIVIEGNTNAEGSREGNGVWRRNRPFREVGSIWALPARML